MTPVFSPDGRWLAYASQNGGKADEELKRLAL
jgi:Tol biopolymer transport system component